MTVTITMDGMIVSARRRDTEHIWDVNITQTLEEDQPTTIHQQFTDEQMSAVAALAIGELPPERAQLNAMLYDIAEPACANLPLALRPIP